MDDLSESPRDDGGLSQTVENLVALGRFGGGRPVPGGKDKILEAIRSNGKQALVVIGDVFMGKDHSVRIRQTRELALAIRERIKSPVITIQELKARYLFGKKEAVKLVSFSIVVIAVFALVFFNQKPILEFMSGDLHQKVKWVAPLAVLIFVPSLAYLYGAVTGLLLKLVGID
jgi:hypothetical protein